MMNRTFEDGARYRQLVRRLIAASLGLLSAMALLALLLRAPRAKASPDCRPLALGVVAGDTEAHDSVYVLDDCGRVRAVQVERVTAVAGGAK